MNDARGVSSVQEFWPLDCTPHKRMCKKRLNGETHERAQMAPGGRIVGFSSLSRVSRVTAKLFGNRIRAGNRCASSWSGYSSPTIGARLS
jgi:hypothetical protein